VPEVLQTSGIAEAEFSFTAHLLPIDRGILETIYFRASQGIRSADDLVAIYRAAYQDEPFVRVYPAGQVPELRVVSRTNFCDLAVIFDSNSGRAIIIALEDNLGKGAAGQAMQNMNLVLGFPETAGLL
jgi:N-acetyl-gamma-glutamyl-phosphate reductase